jgi:hypothetical protein
MNNVSSTAPDFLFAIKVAYTFVEVQQITLEGTRGLNTHDENLVHQQTCTYIQRLCAVPRT